MHYLAFVLVPPDTEDIRATVTHLLAPYEAREGSDRSRWDWWRFGGRWHGILRGRDPHLNGLAFGAEYESLHLNVVPVREIPDLPYPPFAVLTPDGHFHARGNLVGASWVETDRDLWRAEVDRLLSQHGDCLAVAVDYHY